MKKTKEEEVQEERKLKTQEEEKREEIKNKKKENMESKEDSEIKKLKIWFNEEIHRRDELIQRLKEENLMLMKTALKKSEDKLDRKRDSHKRDTK